MEPALTYFVRLICCLGICRSHYLQVPSLLLEGLRRPPGHNQKSPPARAGTSGHAWGILQGPLAADLIFYIIQCLLRVLEWMPCRPQEPTVFDAANRPTQEASPLCSFAWLPGVFHFFCLLVRPSVSFLLSLPRLLPVPCNLISNPCDFIHNKTALCLMRWCRRPTGTPSSESLQPTGFNRRGRK